MKIRNIKDFNNKEIINIVLSLHSDHQMFIKNWGEFIYGKELNLPVELKNRLFTIWFAGALDSIIDKEDQLEPLIKECKERGLKNCLSLLKEFENLTNSIADVINQIDIESQIIILHHRNTIVHARVYSIHNKKTGFLKYLDPASGQTKRFEGTKEDFWKIYRSKTKLALDDFFNPLREKFFNIESDYYSLICQMSKKDFFPKLSSIAYSDM